MTTYSFLNKKATQIYDRFAGRPGDLLLWTGTIGWILSSAAQIAAIGVNNKIPKEQKKFLIPQEMADAAVNIASFFVLTDNFTKLGSHLVSSGKLSTPKIRQLLAKYKLDTKVGTKGFSIPDADEMKELHPNFKSDLKDSYHKFADGISFIFSTIGSIISCNIVTPYARNYLGAKQQQISIAKDKMQNPVMLTTSPVLPAQNRVGMDAYAQKTAVKSTYPSSSSSLKI